MAEESVRVVLERQRILREYARREREVPRQLYEPWRTEELFFRSGRRRVAITLLREAGVFPGHTDHCLEIGFGSLGWLGELICWGIPETQLHGIELDPARARKARAILPRADLLVGDAACLPWPDRSFRLVIASTVFTSILDHQVRQAVAREIERVLRPGGALLWYDFFVNNPRNPGVRAVGRQKLRELFPGLQGHIRSVTLAPPLARWVAPRSWVLATMLEGIPLLRTHLIGVLRKSA